MPLTCTPDALADAAKCYVQLNADVRKAMRVVNLCRLVNGDDPITDIQEQLDAAKCFYDGLTWAQLDAIETFLVCQLVP
jgi:hypothetical protein